MVHNTHWNRRKANILQNRPPTNIPCCPFCNTQSPSDIIKWLTDNVWINRSPLQTNMSLCIGSIHWLQFTTQLLLQCTKIGMAPTSHAVVKLSAQRCDGTFVIPLWSCPENPCPGHCRLSVVLQTIHRFLQSRRRPLLGPSPGWKRLLALSHLRHY